MSDTLHIYRGTNRRFHVLVRGPGCRKYQSVGRPTPSHDAAVRRLARAMTDSRWKRGVVTFISDYYDPTPIFWMHR